MENQSPAAKVEWSSTKVYSLGVICLLLGVILGALFHGPAQSATATPVASEQQAHQAHPSMPQAAAPIAPDPVFEKLKSDPNNFDLLSQAGNASMKTGDAKAAVEYYGHALKVKENVDVRTSLGNAYFRAGDVDQSLQELATVLKADPKNDKALFSVGVVRLMGKKDTKGAIASWETLLKYHPDHPGKAKVLEMIEKTKQIAAQAKG
jgi:cytochrome c-type biogenesis protein CcmH/NrfG